jgi:hypothetical protein
MLEIPSSEVFPTKHIINYNNKSVSVMATDCLKTAAEPTFETLCMSNTVHLKQWAMSKVMLVNLIEDCHKPSENHEHIYVVLTIVLKFINSPPGLFIFSLTRGSRKYVGLLIETVS